MSSVMTDTPAATPGHEHPNQFALLRQRRFAPFFWTQFSGAANVAFDDHPNEKRFGDRIETVTVDSVFAWLSRSTLGGPVEVIR